MSAQPHIHGLQVFRDLNGLSATVVCVATIPPDVLETLRQCEGIEIKTMFVENEERVKQTLAEMAEVMGFELDEEPPGTTRIRVTATAPGVLKRHMPLIERQLRLVLQ